MGNAGTSSSWHNVYKDSAWIYIGGINFDLNEGDIITVFSQYGEVVNINYVRDKVTGKPRGFAFLCYEDQRSTNLAVDNLNGITLVGRTIRVDHVENYKVPKMDELDDETKKLIHEGCAPVPVVIGGIKPKSEVKKEIKEERVHHSNRKSVTDHRDVKREIKREEREQLPRSQRSRSNERKSSSSHHHHHHSRRRSRSGSRERRRSRSNSRERKSRWSKEKSSERHRESRRHGDKEREKEKERERRRERR